MINELKKLWSTPSAAANAAVDADATLMELCVKENT